MRPSSALFGIFFAIALMVMAGEIPAFAMAETAPIRLALQWKPQSQFAGYYMARDHDFYRAAGLNVELLHADVNKTSLAMLRSGEADVATLFLSDALITAAPNGGNSASPAILVQLAQFVRRSNLMLVAWKDHGIATAHDLNGKKISYWQASFSSAFDVFLKTNAIKHLSVPQYYSINLFLQGGTDACAAMEYNEYHRLWQAGIGPERITAFRMRDYGFGFPEDGLYASGKWFNAHRDLADRLRRATLAGWEYARRHPDEAIDTVLNEASRARVPANRPHERWMLQHILDSIFLAGEPAAHVGHLDRDEFNQTADALKRAGQLPRAPAFADFAPFEVNIP